MEITDQLGRTIQIHSTDRIVSLVPSQTELLYTLRLESQLQGITKFCVHPDHLVKTKNVVGGTKRVSLEKIKDLNPDIILCNKEENTAEMVSLLEEIAPVHVSDVKTMGDCLELITQYGVIFNKEKEATVLLRQIQEALENFNAFIKERNRTFSVAYLIWYKPWMAAGASTFINTMLQLNGFVNCLGETERYPTVTVEELRLKKPELVLLSSEPFPFKEEHRKELQQQLPQAKVVMVNGEYFSWFGSRLFSAFDYFKTVHEMQV